ncbi:GNAT family N-acetyltransferase [Niabella hibiscisoli]|uniref:GNAT family N-acetyltransferase n=1 Tax=Niabella hibiscisoli TaxID=1825928 RepID=UPI001F0E947F|nr:GNAT family N-acetyltransferase [Niabella hibiscisoli]MCH5716953.1 GNAT family N-acetyltransferase [Niabella hibiscisoli]
MSLVSMPDDLYFKGYRFSFNKQAIPKNVVFRYLSGESYWAKDISIEMVERSIENSICLGIYDKDGLLAGFGRMITDRAVFAYLADVFILETHRGQGLSKIMVQAFCDLAEQFQVRRTMLATLDAHGLYAQFDFEQLPNPECFMTRKGVTY